MLVGAGLVAAVIAAYHNSFGGPFVFDDPLAITENPTIRQLWPLTDVLFPPQGEGLSVEGRPVLNLTLAVNYAVGGTTVRGYHAVNLFIHVLATLTVFGLVRRTLRLPGLGAHFAANALPLAGVIAALWSLHPLQTESVTYIIQRAESLVSLFYLLTLYCFLRSVESTHGREPHTGAGTGQIDRSAVSAATTATRGKRDELQRANTWLGLGVVACFIGMATKEVMVSAPLLVLLFDAVFVTGTLREAWRRRWRTHLVFFSTWILLAALVLRTGTRGGTAGFGINVTPFAYALTQFEAVTRYVWLSLWPHPLIFDYGVKWVNGAADVLPYAFVPGSLIAATIAAWWKCPPAAFLGVLFFAVLSPTSSIVPGNRQTLAEHRMYLPLVPIVVLIVCGTYLVASDRRQRRTLFSASIAAAIALGVLTMRRNSDYRSELTLYQDTAIKRPQNGFARYNLGKALAEAGRHAEALLEYEEALRLMGNAPGIHYNLANSLAALGRSDEAIAHYQIAVKTEPHYARAHFNLGNILIEAGRKQEAATHLAAAVAADPKLVEARVNLGGVLLELGRLDEARGHFEYVLRREPNHVLALFNLGNVCLLQQHWANAVRLFENVIALRPDLTVARERLEMAKAGRTR
jgi:protein O-mannosyl-transferase